MEIRAPLGVLSRVSEPFGPEKKREAAFEEKKSIFRKSHFL